MIGKAGRPVARLVPYAETSRQRTPGRGKGVRIAADFDDTPADLIDAFDVS